MVSEWRVCVFARASAIEVKEIDLSPAAGPQWLGLVTACIKVNHRG